MLRVFLSLLLEGSNILYLMPEIKWQAVVAAAAAASEQLSEIKEKIYNLTAVTPNVFVFFFFLSKRVSFEIYYQRFDA